MKFDKRFLIAILAVATLALAGSILGGPEQFRPRSGDENLSAVDSPDATVDATVTAEVPPVADQLSTAFERVAELIRPSVVSVSSVRKITARTSQLPDSFTPFREFFGNPFFDPFFRNGPGEGRMQQGQGTGFVVSREGYVLTNHHVVAGADEVTVRLGEKSHSAEIVGTDAKTDLAVLRIEAENLTPARFGDSDELRVGQWVVAAGDPFGLASSITAGIVSATGRSRVGLADYEDFIQTDAAINPGNSGGPLVNLRGEVVGINTAILTRSGGNMGIGLAIPVNMARSVMESLIDDGRVVRGWLGVMIQDLDEDLAASFGFDSTRGALVGDVTADSPAAKAGLEAGDIVTRYGGEPVEDVDGLRLEVAATRPGTRVDVEVFRDGRTRELEVEIGELEEEAAAGGSGGGGSTAEKLGMSVRTLTPEVAARLGYSEDLAGVVVAEVQPFSAAARAGVRPRDVIVEVQGEAVTTVEELRRELKRHDLERGVRLVLRSGGSQRFAFLKTGG